jgi:hypothetical protein
MDILPAPKPGSGEDLIEQGVGLIAAGAFRMANDENNPVEAEAALHSVVNVMCAMHGDFMRKSKTVGGMAI